MLEVCINALLFLESSHWCTTLSHPILDFSLIPSRPLPVELLLSVEPPLSSPLASLVDGLIMGPISPAKSKPAKTIIIPWQKQSGTELLDKDPE